MRKMQKISKVFVWAISLLAIASCSDGGGENSVSTANVMSVSILPDTWTYISLSDGKTVGTDLIGGIAIRRDTVCTDDDGVKDIFGHKSSLSAAEP